MGFYDVFKGVAFRMDPEEVHEKTIKLFSRFPGLAKLWSEGEERESSRYMLRTGDLSWNFPVGLAAGLDKNGECLDFFSRLLFGGIEVGTVTPLPQEGNPRPRLFRFVKEESLRNMMGFNSKGAEEVYGNILRSRGAEGIRGKVLGVNLGKNKVTPNEQAIDDYMVLYKKFAPVADYLVINISSPNTPGLRSLQNTGFLRELLDSLQEERKISPRPLYIKIAPELMPDEIKDIVEVAKENSVTGLLASNTGVYPKYGPGGISGKLLRERARECRRRVLEMAREVSPFQVIGVGGISSFADIWEFWKLGGKVVQLYTAFIYQGPELLLDIRKKIDRILQENRIHTLEELLENIQNITLPSDLS